MFITVAKGGTPKSNEDARRKIRIEPLTTTNLGTAKPIVASKVKKIIGFPS